MKYILAQVHILRPCPEFVVWLYNYRDLEAETSKSCRLAVFYNHS